LEGEIVKEVLSSVESKAQAKYKIPDEIKARIPPYFYIAFAGELCSVFGRRIFEKDKSGVYGLSYVGSTCGWGEAFRMTCQKTDLSWLADYYKELEWNDSDLFDGEVENEIISRFIETQPSGDNVYYQFLLSRTHPKS